MTFTSYFFSVEYTVQGPGNYGSQGRVIFKVLKATRQKKQSQESFLFNLEKIQKGSRLNWIKLDFIFYLYPHFISPSGLPTVHILVQVNKGQASTQALALYV